MKRCALALVLAFAAMAHAWTYSAQDEWPLPCPTGKRQSPIDLGANTSVPTYAAAPFQFSGQCMLSANEALVMDASVKGLSARDKSLNCVIKDQADGIAGLVKEFHFHMPSEHWLPDGAGDAELHIVTQRQDDPSLLMVVGVLIRQSESVEADSSAQTTALLNIFRETPPTTKFNLADFLPTKGDFFAYTGSLTTPTCDEIVSWRVVQKPLYVPSRVLQELRGQMLSYGTLYNARSLQNITSIHRVRKYGNSLITAVFAWSSDSTDVTLVVVFFLVLVCVVGIVVYMRNSAQKVAVVPMVTTNPAAAELQQVAPPQVVSTKA